MRDATLFTQNRLDDDSKMVERLLFQRARILKKTSVKATILRDILSEHPLKRGLVYCADMEQLDQAHEVLNELGLVHLIYVGDTPGDKRQATLDALAAGRVPAILAIDCLDEGVDVPAVDTAIILASSTNERQFIQRRGRVLRRSAGKKQATLVDVITIPPRSAGGDGKWLLKGELARAMLMAELAENKHEALLALKHFTKQYGVLLTELLAEEPHAEGLIRDAQDAA